MGYRRDPINGGDDFHAGLDIAGDKGQPVYATAEGRVVQSGYQGAYGNTILIDHGFGLQTRYGHLQDASVRHGDHVKRGDVIGHVGATGRARAEPEHEASARHVVELHGSFGDPQRVVVAGADHAGAEPDVARALCGGGDEDLRGGDHLGPRRVVLADPRLVVVEPIQMLDQLEVALEQDRRIDASRMERRHEDPKTHP